MLELFIERWKSATGKTDFFWSVWHDGRQLQRGPAHETPDAAEEEGRQFCLAAIGRPAERVIRL